MNVILILDKEIPGFEIIADVPDDMIEDAEKVEDFLQENGFDLNRIEWISDEYSTLYPHTTRERLANSYLAIVDYDNI